MQFLPLCTKFQTLVAAYFISLLFIYEFKINVSTQFLFARRLSVISSYLPACVLHTVLYLPFKISLFPVEFWISNYKHGSLRQFFSPPNIFIEDFYHLFQQLTLSHANSNINQCYDSVTGYNNTNYILICIFQRKITTCT